MNRIEYLQEQLALFALDAVVINPGASLKYLTGLDFHLMERPVILFIAKAEKPKIVLPELEKAKLDGLETDLDVYFMGDDPGKWHAVFQEAFGSSQGDGLRVGVEPTRLRFLELTLLSQALEKADFVNGSNLFSALRMHKDKNEIRKMRKAAEIAENALLATLRKVKKGQTEREIAAELLIQLYQHGSDQELPFPPIVSTGPNTANPHASPTDRKFEDGEILLIDWGASFEGYLSDITRCFYLENLPDRMRDIAETVQRANHYAVSYGKLGMKAGEIDRIARQEIEESGYGQYFIHRTGHGLGMEAHEAPFIFAENDQVLEKGMVFTVEPGIYVPGEGGVRIEDDVVVTEEGLMSLTSLPREVMTIDRYLDLMDLFTNL